MVLRCTAASSASAAAAAAAAAASSSTAAVSYTALYITRAHTTRTSSSDDGFPGAVVSIGGEPDCGVLRSSSGGRCGKHMALCDKAACKLPVEEEGDILILLL